MDKDLGLICWRRTHKLDKPEDQRRGWNVRACFTAPQSQEDIDHYLRIMSRGEWIEPYSYEVVPFAEQEERVTLKRGELTGWGVPGRARNPKIDALPLDETHLGIQWRGD